MFKIIVRTRTNNQSQNDLLLTNNYRIKKIKYRDKIQMIQLKSLIILIKLLILTYAINGQIKDQKERFNLNGATIEYQWPNPGEPNYRTYIFNGRRYGRYQPNYSGHYPNDNISGGGRYPTGKSHIDNFNFDPNSPNAGEILFPGVLAGWREDLQGKQRRDSLILERDVFVTTNYGEIQGFKVYMYDNPDPKSFYRPYHSTVDRVMGECSVFLGIPYAMPPTQEGRFKPPRLHRGWQLLQAVDYGPACPQPLRYTGAAKGINDVDEDCLYLNVFSPKTGAGVAQKYPVLVYIHGGKFIHGASNLFQGHVLASFYGVVVVTLNYRLGALGFLSTADENSPGNYGVLDQIVALKWVYDNIEFFNGDRDLITLFGPGAGAASSGLLMVAPQTRHIVRRVIAQSGSPLADWAFIQDKYRVQNTSRVLGQVLGCSIDSSWKLVNCLRTRNPFDLGEAEFPPDVGTFPWGPVLDHNFTVPGNDWYDGWREKDWHFLTETPLNLLKKGLYNKGLQYMTGVTTQEAAYFISQNESLAPHYEISRTFFEEKIKELVFRYNYTLNPKGVYEAIKYMYTYWPYPNNASVLRDQYINMLSDFYYAAPVDQIVKILLENRVPVYLYVMNTTVEALNFPEWRKYPHNIEHYFLSGAPFMDVEFFPKSAHLQRNMWTDNDRNMSHFFLQTFSNFARYGNPTPQQVLGLHFEQAYQGELRYLNINTTFNSTIKLNYRQTECAFWTQYLPTVIGILVPTYPPTTEYWWEPKEPLQIAFWSMSVACFILIVMVVVCCIMWRNAKRQSDRYYDEDIFIDPGIVEYEQDLRASGIENVHMSNNRQGTRSPPDNIYEYRDSSSTKALASKMVTETASSSLRSPSSLGIIQKSESQSSMKSINSLKESTVGGTTSTYMAPVTHSQQQNGTTNDHLSTNGNIITTPQITSKLNECKNQQQKKEEPIILPSTALKRKNRKYSMPMTTTGTVSIPTARSNLSSTTPTHVPVAVRGDVQQKFHVWTQIIEGIPQTSV